MGKTSLLLRILNQAVNQGYQTININFDQIDCSILRDLDRFLRFLCASATQQLNLEPKLEEYWDDDIGSKVSCSLYLKIGLEKLLQTASTNDVIYHRHLRHQWLTLQQEPELGEVFKIMLQTNHFLELEPIIAYKLSSIGLIKEVGNEAIVSCKLYRDYFTKNFIETDSKIQICTTETRK